MLPGLTPALPDEGDERHFSFDNFGSIPFHSSSPDGMPHTSSSFHSLPLNMPPRALPNQDPLKIDPASPEYKSLFEVNFSYFRDAFITKFPTILSRSGDNDKYKQHEYNTIINDNAMGSFESEYEARKALNNPLYGEDMKENIYEVAYDSERGWHSVDSPNVRFPYTSIYVFNSYEETRGFQSNPHISYTMLPFPSHRNEDLSKIKLSVIINSYDKTPIDRFAYLLASFKCEIMHPIMYSDANVVLDVYKRLLRLMSIDVSIDFNKLVKNILHTFPSQLDEYDMSAGGIQLILAHDVLNDPTEEDLKNRKYIHDMFINYCKQYNIKDYTIFSPKMNLKVAGMRNVSLKYTTGNFIIFRDADDLSTSLGSIVRKCLDYGTPNWKTGKILRYSCMFSRNMSFRSFGMWSLIIPKELAKYIRNDPTMSAGEDTALHINLMFQGVLQEADDGTNDNPLCSAHELYSFNKLLNEGYQFLNKEVIVSNDNTDGMALYGYSRLGFEMFACIIALYEKYKDKLGSHYEVARECFRKALNNAKEYYETTRLINFDNIGTFMYLYCDPSYSYISNLPGVSYIRTKTFLDCIVPNNPFNLDSPYSFELRISDPLDMNLFSMKPDKDIYKYRFVHPDEQTRLSITSCYNDNCKTEEESRWVTNRVVGLPPDRTTKPLQQSMEGIHKHNTAMKFELMSTMIGGNTDAIIKIFAFILLLCIIVMVIKYSIYFTHRNHKFFNINQRNVKND